MYTQITNEPNLNAFSLHSFTPYLKVYHILGVRGFHIAGWSDLDARLLQLTAEEPQLPLHLFTASYLVDELALKGTYVWVQL